MAIGTKCHSPTKRKLTMITEVLVSREIAELLKEKGFHENVRYEYHHHFTTPSFHRRLRDFNGAEYNGLKTEWYSAPTQQTALAWVRKMYNKIIIIRYGKVGYADEPSSKWQLQWWWELLNSRGEFCESNINTGNSSPEEAVEDALKYTLENIV